MFCTSCGTKNASDSNFCRQCGSKLDRAVAAKINADAFERAMPEEEQVSALLERAYRLRKDGDLAGAIALCRDALVLRADSTSTHSLLGQLYEQSGDHEAAVREYERVLELNPGSIADRVKLDELRGQAGETGERKTPARVVMADPQSHPSLGYARFTSAGLAVALLALGGLVALQFRPHSPAPATSGDVAQTRTSLNAAGETGITAAPANASVANKQDLTATVPDAKGTLLGPLGPVSSAPNAPTANASAPNGQVASSALPASSNTRVVYTQGPTRYIPVPVAAAGTAAAPVHLPGVKRNHPAQANSASDPNGTKPFRLDPDVTEENDKMTIKVSPKDVGKKGDPYNEKPNPNDRVVVDRNPSGTARTAPAPGPSASSESRSYMTIAQDKKRQQDYKGAIDAFTKALATAGDQAGYALQQRAICYQHLNDLSSAKSDYESAISEYRKLEARDPETARNGVRVCEKGIKACGN